MKKFFMKILLQDWLDEMKPKLPVGVPMFEYNVEKDKTEYVGYFQKLSDDVKSYAVILTLQDETIVVPVRNLSIEVEVYFNPKLIEE